MLYKIQDIRRYEIWYKTTCHTYNTGHIHGHKRNDRNVGRELAQAAGGCALPIQGADGLVWSRQVQNQGLLPRPLPRWRDICVRVRGPADSILEVPHRQKKFGLLFFSFCLLFFDLSPDMGRYLRASAGTSRLDSEIASQAVFVCVHVRGSTDMAQPASSARRCYLNVVVVLLLLFCHCCCIIIIITHHGVWNGLTGKLYKKLDV